MTASVNSHLPEQGDPRIVILSCPKTGNVWVRWLLHYAYGVPTVDLPMAWSDVAGSLPPAFVTHQHLWPSESLIQWLNERRITVVTTIRHPGDTLMSYFHFMKWAGNPADAAKRMVEDGERPGDRTLEFVKGVFVPTYEIPLLWARLGAKVVRYESLLENPVAALIELTAGIKPIAEETATAAAFLSKPEQLFAAGVDSRHIRTGSAGAWKSELRLDIVEAMASMDPYRAACETFGYDWDANAASSPAFDYASIDPFGGREHFDNGERIAPWMARIYLLGTQGARRRWRDPTLTSGDSFWNWLLSTRDGLPNLVLALRDLRPDLQKAFPDPAGADRRALLNWFFDHGVAEHSIAPRAASSIRERYLSK